MNGANEHYFKVITTKMKDQRRDHCEQESLET